MVSAIELHGLALTAWVYGRDPAYRGVLAIGYVEFATYLK
jgi:hypothetical protein